MQHTVQHTVWVDATTREGLLLQTEGLDAQLPQLPQLSCNCCNSHSVSQCVAVCCSVSQCVAVSVAVSVVESVTCGKIYIDG